jgi:Zn-dependent protease with chaperone function
MASGKHDMTSTTSSSTRSVRPAGKARSARVGKRAMLVLGLWLSFWILALGLVAGLLWIPFAQSTYRSTVEFSGFVAGLAGLTLAYALRPRWRARDRSKPVEPLSRESAAPLYAEVERIGKKLGITTPVQIHLVGGATAFISGKRNWYGKIRGLDVGIGLPLLGTLSEQELGSVIAHEFGHFVAGDLSLGPWVYRVRIALAQTVMALDDSMFFLDVLFRYYGAWFLRLSAGVSREQEFAADAAAARQFGTRATCEALAKVHLIDPMWSAYFDLELEPALRRGARMPIFEGFRQFTRPGARRPEIVAAIARAESRPKSEFDSHPTLAERVEALRPGRAVGYPALSECHQLVGGEAATEAAWYALFTEHELGESDWSKYGRIVLQAQVRARFAGSWMDPAKLGFGELVPMAANPGALWDNLKPEGISFLSPMGKRRHVMAILEEWIIACLDQRGFVAVVQPGLALEMRKEGKVIVPAAMLSSALAGTLTTAELDAIGPIPAPAYAEQAPDGPALEGQTPDGQAAAQSAPA